MTYNEQGRYQDAREAYKKMLAARKTGTTSSHVDPYVRGKLANMHAEVAAAYEQAGLLADAIRELERALALCPSYVDIRGRLAASYRSIGDLPAATREYERVKKENGKLAGPRLQLGLTHYAAGRTEEAAKEWSEVMALQPDNKFAKMYLALVSGAAARNGPARAEVPQQLMLTVARFVASPETFVVEEIPAYQPSGEGEHTYLWIEKRGLTTPEAERRLGQALRVSARDIGHAGMKDRHATTRQYLSLLGTTPEAALAAGRGQGDGASTAWWCWRPAATATSCGWGT